MEHINNEADQVEIRRLQDNLTIVGSGIILFGVWTAVKVIGSVFMLKNETITALKEMPNLTEDIPDDIIFYVLIVMSVIFFLIDILLRSYIGLSAIREGRGSRKRHSGCRSGYARAGRYMGAPLFCRHSGSHHQQYRRVLL